jgi:hypothetical protein
MVKQGRTARTFIELFAEDLRQKTDSYMALREELRQKKSLMELTRRRIDLITAAIASHTPETHIPER